MARSLCTFFITILFLAEAHAQLTFEDYWREVKEAHQLIRASELVVQSAEAKKSESDLVFHPSVFASGQYSDDSRPASASLFTGTANQSKTWQVGVSELLPVGTQLKLSYGATRTELKGTNPLYVSVTEYYDVGPSIELTQSLWRNFLGSENRAQVQALDAQADALRSQEKFTLKNYKVTAENIFWRLYYAQQSLTIMQENLSWAKKLRDWNAHRVEQSLADEIDLLQAESNLKTRELELQVGKMEADLALRSFQQFRQTQIQHQEQNQEVKLKVDERQTGRYLLQLNTPLRAPEREDLLAAKKSFEAIAATAELGQEKNLPLLELFGSYGRYGRDAAFSEAQDEALQGDHELGVIGLKLVAPLDFSTSAQARQGYALEKQAALQRMARKQFDVDQEWSDQVKKFRDLQERLALSLKMQEVQTKKLQREKERYNRGRTTTFQVLQFGQDLASARLGTLKGELELLSIYNQLKLFEDGSHE